MDIRVYNRKKKEWRWAVLGDNGQYPYARIDTQQGESLEDFDVWEVKNIEKFGENNEKEKFTLIRKMNIPRHYS